MGACTNVVIQGKTMGGNAALEGVIPVPMELYHEKVMTMKNQKKEKMKA